MNPNINLDKVIIKISIGIGRNVREAEIALKKAKQNKYRNLLYNFCIYKGPKLIERRSSTFKMVSAYFNLRNKIKNSPKLIKDLESFKYDYKTGLLNQMGYLIESQNLRNNNKYKNRVIFMIDGDNMHDCNSKFGYDIVDKYLTNIGQSINMNIRKESREGQKDFADICRILNHRKNDSAGDEFIIDLSLDYNNKDSLKSVVKRYIENIYFAEMKITDKLKLI